VSSTVIHGCILSSLAVYLQIQHVLSSLEMVKRYIIFCDVTVSFVSNACNPLQPLPWSPLSPLHEVIAEDKSRGCTGEAQGPCRLHQASPRLHQLYFTLDTCSDRESLPGNCHTYKLFLSLMSTHIHLASLFYTNHILK
jgi:hypothetical protein